MTYPDAVNPDVLMRIPLSAATILDIGCGKGATGMEYKRRNPAARYFGVEEDVEAASVALTRLDEVIVGNIEEMAAPFDPERFDCIVLGDVLEHMRDPWTVLGSLAGRLMPGGVVVICMPNLEHWSFAARLLMGGWDYEPMGLFDRSHLRWFTLDTTLRAIRQTGLLPHDVAGRVFDQAACDGFVEQVTPALTALGVDPADYRRRAAPIQHVWRAVGQPTPRINIVSTMLNPVGGVSQVRVTDPMGALSTRPDAFTLITRNAELPNFDPDSPKIFIFHRPALIGEDGLLPIRQLIELGFVIVCEFDDHPDYIPILQTPDVQNFRAVHAVQTSTPALAAVLGRENPEIAVFPNAIARLSDPQNFAREDRITLFFGSINREAEWPEYLEVLNAVAAELGERLHFEIVNDAGLFDGLITPHKNFTPLCDYDTYNAILSRCEISFMPLSDTPFNRCKSDLKFLEASAHRVAALASQTVYGDVIEDGRTGVVFRDPRDLHRRLLAMVAQPDATRRMAEAAREHVERNRMLAAQVDDRMAWYKDLWARRHQLNEALLQRVPQLRDGLVSGLPPA